MWSKNVNMAAMILSILLSTVTTTWAFLTTPCKPLLALMIPTLKPTRKVPYKHHKGLV